MNGSPVRLAHRQLKTSSIPITSRVRGAFQIQLNRRSASHHFCPPFRALLHHPRRCCLLLLLLRPASAVAANLDPLPSQLSTSPMASWESNLITAVQPPPPHHPPSTRWTGSTMMASRQSHTGSSRPPPPDVGQERWAIKPLATLITQCNL